MDKKSSNLELLLVCVTEFIWNYWCCYSETVIGFDPSRRRAVTVRRLMLVLFPQHHKV